MMMPARRGHRVAKRACWSHSCTPLRAQGTTARLIIDSGSLDGVHYWCAAPLPLPLVPPLPRTHEGHRPVAFTPLPTPLSTPHRFDAFARKLARRCPEDDPSHAKLVAAAERISALCADGAARRARRGYMRMLAAATLVTGAVAVTLQMSGAAQLF